MTLGQEPRQTISNVCHLNITSIKALIHGLNRQVIRKQPLLSFSRAKDNPRSGYNYIIAYFCQEKMGKRDREWALPVQHYLIVSASYELG
nr:26S proteasome non-ATPase regulatory subunit 14 homolog [Tanacetum cinerariifolium]